MIFLLNIQKIFQLKIIFLLIFGMNFGIMLIQLLKWEEHEIKIFLQLAFRISAAAGDRKIFECDNANSSLYMNSNHLS